LFADIAATSVQREEKGEEMKHNLYIKRLDNESGAYQLFSAGNPDEDGYYRANVAILYSSNNELISIDTDRIFPAEKCMAISLPNGCTFEGCKGDSDFLCDTCRKWSCESHTDMSGACLKCAPVEV
jgi:hypothetical protein